MDSIAHWAGRKGADTALVCGSESVSWHEYREMRNRFAHGLAQLELDVGARVVTYHENSVEGFVVAAACEALGLTIVPVNHRLSPAEVEFIIADSDAEVVVFGAEFDSVVNAVRPVAPSVRNWISIGYSRYATVEFASMCAESSSVDVDRPGASGGTILYTSGTTGRPKGAFRRAGRAPAALRSFVAAVVDSFCIRNDDAHLAVAPLYHSAPRAFAGIAGSLGKTIVMHARFDPSRALVDIEQYGVGDTFMAPILVKRLLDADSALWESTELGSLHSLVVAGAPCPMSVKRRIHDRLGDALYEFYGATEFSVCTLLEPSEQFRRAGSCGRPFPGVELAVFDEDGRAVPDGDVGELFVRRNEMTISGYHNRPGALDDVSRGDWVSVGDIAYFDDDGFVYLCDRKQDVIISGGVNIYPAEVESALHGHYAVEDVAVFGVPDDEWGESVHAVISLRQGDRLNAAQLREWSTPHLASFKFPRTIEFGSVPRDRLGKLMRRELRQRHWAGRDTQVR